MGVPELVLYHGALVGWRTENTCFLMKAESFEKYKGDTKIDWNKKPFVTLECDPEKASMTMSLRFFISIKT